MNSDCDFFSTEHPLEGQPPLPTRAANAIRLEKVEDVYLRCAKRLLNVIRSQMGTELAKCVDPEDVMQSVFQSFIRGVNEERYQISEDEDLWKLFCVLAMNKVRKYAEYHRAARRDVRLTKGLTPEMIELANDEQSELNPVMCCIVRDVLGNFLPTHQEIIDLRIQGYKVGEIARRIGRSKRTVERILAECRTRLMELLG